MEFINPAMWWAAAAVAIPIAIHLWHQKKGQLMPWAATRWLLEKNQTPQRGLRLEKWLLLLLRCLLVLLLAMILAEPFLKKNDSSATLPTVHLVQPDEFILENYRFELTKAQQDGDELRWLTPEASTINDALTPDNPSRDVPSSVLIQGLLNQLADKAAIVHVYVRNERNKAQLPVLQAAVPVFIHAPVDTLHRVVRNFRLVKNNQKLHINARQLLSNGPLDTGLRLAENPVAEGPLPVLVLLKNETERTTVVAAVKAFAEVYGLELVLDFAQKASQPYSLVVSDEPLTNPNPNTVYVLTGETQETSSPNINVVKEPLTPQTSTLVANGQLPEWLGQKLLTHWKLRGDALPWSRGELSRRVKQLAPDQAQASAGNLHTLLLLLFLVFISLERSLALTKYA
ncbi:BatA domain-containing protein [Arundinibacter roseus]|uniref:Aerotolerance regulator N-terminal domain-containing protein n=1 Tax=Arundinibacter roseus TaxID=2070510 RepID=A0A4R4K0K8_9BACT|nr:BatA domain-containing protein [Arundinibacter roseus]TDB60807.1 hypothetical protein EZE20_20390 [Arundinibacter roseus]